MHILPNWQNPTPTLAETGLDPEALARLAGNRLLLFSLPPRDIDVLARGELRHYKSAVFRGSALVLPVPADRVQQHLRNYSAYAAHIPNTDTVDVKSRQGVHAQVEYRHVFRLSMMTVGTRLLLQHTQEEDGSLSAWLVDGDADAAVSRWQIVALDAERTLVVYFNWADIASINLLINMLLKAQPDMAVAAPYGAAFVAIEALRRAFMPDETTAPAPEYLPEHPFIPAFPAVREHALLPALAAAGPIVLVDGGQWLCRDGDVHRQRFVAVAGNVDICLEQAFRHSLRFDRYTEFFPLAQKVVVKPRSEGFAVDWQVGIGLGFFSLGVHYRLAYTQTAAHTLQFRQEEGDLAHIDGEWQWQALDENKALGALTISNHIGNKPPLVLRFAQQFPYHDILAGIYMGLMGIQRMSQWMSCQEPLPLTDDSGLPSSHSIAALVTARPARRLQ